MKEKYQKNFKTQNFVQRAKLRFAWERIIISEKVPFNLDEVSVEGERWGGAYPRKYRSRSPYTQVTDLDFCSIKLCGD